MSNDFDVKEPQFKRRGAPATLPGHQRNGKPVGGDRKLTDDAVRKTFLMVSRFGACTEDVAQFLDVPAHTVSHWLSKGRQSLVKGDERSIYARFLISMKSGCDVFNTEQVEKALVKRATGYTYTERKVERSRMNVRELRCLGISIPEHLIEEGQLVKVCKETVTEKEVTPDTTAAIFYLQNRAGNRWKNVRHVEANIKGGVDHRHLHGFVGGVDPAVMGQKEQKLLTTAHMSDEELKVLENLLIKQESDDAICAENEPEQGSIDIQAFTEEDESEDMFE